MMVLSCELWPGVGVLWWWCAFGGIYLASRNPTEVTCWVSITSKAPSVLLRQYFVHNIFRHFAIKYNHKNNYNAGKESHIGYSWFTNKVHLLYKENNCMQNWYDKCFNNFFVWFCRAQSYWSLPRPERATTSKITSFICGGCDKSSNECLPCQEVWSRKHYIRTRSTGFCCSAPAIRVHQYWWPDHVTIHGNEFWNDNV